MGTAIVVLATKHRDGGLEYRVRRFWDDRILFDKPEKRNYPPRQWGEPAFNREKFLMLFGKCLVFRDEERAWEFADRFELECIRRGITVEEATPLNHESVFFPAMKKARRRRRVPQVRARQSQQRPRRDGLYTVHDLYVNLADISLAWARGVDFSSLLCPSVDTK
jgi:hypothetical protein